MAKLIKIEMEIKGVKIKLTPDECRELKDELEKIVPNYYYTWIRPIPDFTYPTVNPIPYTTTTT